MVKLVQRFKIAETVSEKEKQDLLQMTSLVPSQEALRRTLELPMRWPCAPVVCDSKEPLSTTARQQGDFAALQNKGN